MFRCIDMLGQSSKSVQKKEFFSLGLWGKWLGEYRPDFKNRTTFLSTLFTAGLTKFLVGNT